MQDVPFDLYEVAILTEHSPTSEVAMFIPLAYLVQMVFPWLGCIPMPFAVQHLDGLSSIFDGFNIGFVRCQDPGVDVGLPGR